MVGWNWKKAISIKALVLSGEKATRYSSKFHQRISCDSSFIGIAVESVTLFIKFTVLSELVGIWFSKQSVVYHFHKILIV